MRLLELAVDHHGAQEDEAHGHQVAELVDLEAVEDADDLAGQDGREVELPDQERDGLAVLEGVALDAVVDDRLRHRQRQEIEDLRQHHEAQDDDLLGPAVSPDVGEQIALHQYPRWRPRCGAPSLLYSIRPLITFDILHVREGFASPARLWHSPAEYTGRGRRRFGQGETPRMPHSSRSKRVLIYSHDSFGLGHVSRCRTIANALVEADPIGLGPDRVGLADDRLLRVPLGHRLRAHSGRGQADRTATTTRPTCGSASSTRWRCGPASSATPPTSTVPTCSSSTRSRLGLRGEVVPALRLLKERGTPLVLGLRDVMDDPDSARRRMGAQERRAGAARPLRRDLDLRPAADQQAADRHRGAAVGAPQDGLYRLSAPRPAAAHRRAARDGGDRRSLHPGHRRAAAATAPT